MAQKSQELLNRQSIHQYSLLFVEQWKDLYYEHCKLHLYQQWSPTKEKKRLNSLMCSFLCNWKHIYTHTIFLWLKKNTLNTEKTDGYTLKNKEEKIENNNKNTLFFFPASKDKIRNDFNNKNKICHNFNNISV